MKDLVEAPEIGDDGQPAEIGHNNPPANASLVIEAIQKGENVTHALDALRENHPVVEFDLTTAKGRKELTSACSAITKFKTEIEAAGKEMVSGWKAKSKVVDADRKTSKEYFEAWRDELRKPLTEWEANDQARKDKMNTLLDSINANRVAFTDSADEIRVVLEEIKALVVDESWAEFQDIAELKREVTLDSLTSMLEAAELREKDAVELAELRAAAAKREKADKEQEIKDAAAKKQRAKAKAESERIRLEKANREEAAKLAKEQAERNAAEARKKAAADHERELQEAKDKAAKDIADEKQRVADEKQAEIDEKLKREADEAHVEIIRAAIYAAVYGFTGDQAPAENITNAIFNGEIPHVEVKL